VELSALRRDLARLVTEEKYEEAARVRDRIRQLEQG
jgi:protein arginine kinase activator